MQGKTVQEKYKIFLDKYSDGVRRYASERENFIHGIKAKKKKDAASRN